MPHSLFNLVNRPSSIDRFCMAYCYVLVRLVDKGAHLLADQFA